MGPRAYYNEHDPFAAAWLRNLIADGQIAPGDVDERDIRDVHPDDLRGYRQAHFFAGIGVWSYALRLAGWSDDRPVWTGSCPCQPFSAAGRGAGTADERHLWPALSHLIEGRRPSVFFGEQVASRDGLDWLDLVLSDLEDAGYDVGAADLCAAGVGAPHIRQRSWFVAHAGCERRQRRPSGGGTEREGSAERREEAVHDQRRGGVGGLGHTELVGARRYAGAGFGEEGGTGLRAERHDARSSGSAGVVLGDAGGEGWGEVGQDGRGRGAGGAAKGRAERPLHERSRGQWADLEWLACRDGKARPTQPGLFPLAHGATARVGRLRGYGNAIVAQAAAAFIRSADAAMANAELLRLNGGLFA